MISCSKKLRFLLMAVLPILALSAATGNVYAADVVIVAHPGVTDSSLSDDQLKGIFLGQMKNWPSGAKAEVVTLKDSAGIHQDFLKKYIGRSATQFGNSWKQIVFTGKGRMPKQFDTEAKLIEYISSSEGAIGYVSAGAAKGSAKTISIK